MNAQTPSKLDRALAGICSRCPMCRRARRKQSGAAFQLVRKVETKICPFCCAYERVYGRKSHETITTADR